MVHNFGMLCPLKYVMPFPLKHSFYCLKFHPLLTTSISILRFPLSFSPIGFFPGLHNSTLFSKQPLGFWCGNTIFIVPLVQNYEFFNLFHLTMHCQHLLGVHIGLIRLFAAYSLQSQTMQGLCMYNLCNAVVTMYICSEISYHCDNVGQSVTHYCNYHLRTRASV